MRNKMNQVQKTGGTTNINVEGIPTEGYFSGDKIADNSADDYHKIQGQGVKSSDLFQGPTVSTVPTKISGASIIDIESGRENEDGREIGQLDLSDEGVDEVAQGREYPKAHADYNSEAGTMEPQAGSEFEINEDELKKQERLMAENLELLIKKQQGETARNISTNNTTDKLEAFMNTETTSIEKDTTPNGNEGVFGNAELSSKVTGIKEVKEGTIEIKKLLTAKEREIQEVRSRIGVLGVDEGAATALVRELEEYKLKLEESNSELQEQLNELRETIQNTPEALTALGENSEATAIPEVKELLNSMAKVAPITEAGLDGALTSKDTTEAVIEKATGGLIGAIKVAMLKMDSTVDDKQVGEVFEIFARGILNELKAEGMSHGEALAEYQAMVKALEASNGVIEIIRGENGEMSASIKNNINQGNVHADRSENFVDTAADDYNNQSLGMAV